MFLGRSVFVLRRMEKAFYHVNWIKMLQILKYIGVYWRERRLVRSLYMGEIAKWRLSQGETESVETGRRVRQPYMKNI